MQLTIISHLLALDVQNLSFRYRSDDPPVLDGISLQMPPGEALAMTGPNGGGKTTLINLLTAAQSPTGGTIRIAGLSPEAACRQGDVLGFVPQSFRPPARLPVTTRQMVHAGLLGRCRLLQSPARQDVAFADELMDRLKLSALAGKPASELSGGQRQAALIARALAARPHVLLLDEPTAALDVDGRARVLGLLSELRAEMGFAMLMITHDLPAALDTCDRAMRLARTLTPLSLDSVRRHLHDGCTVAGIELLVTSY